MQRSRSFHPILKIVAVCGAAAALGAGFFVNWRADRTRLQGQMQERVQQLYEGGLASAEEAGRDPSFKPAYRQFLVFLNLAESVRAWRDIHTELQVPGNAEELLQSARQVARARARAPHELRRLRELERRLELLEPASEPAG
jgi:hypothetical protein